MCRWVDQSGDGERNECQDLVHKSRMTGLGNWRKVHCLEEVRARDRARDSNAEGKDRVWLNGGTNEADCNRLRADLHDMSFVHAFPLFSMKLHFWLYVNWP